MSIKATGQITIVDLTDQRSSIFYLQSDTSKTQVANINKSPTEYTPDFTTQHVTITPVFCFGNEQMNLTNDQIDYYINEVKVNTKISSSASDPTNQGYFIRNGQLIIKQNVPDFDATQIRIRASVLAGLVDPETDLKLPNDIDATFEISVIETGRSGDSLSKIETYYKTTTEYKVPSINDTDWDQNASKFTLSATNKYLWAYQKTYTKNNLGAETSTNGNVFLAGTYGDTGATGVAGTSVDSITEQYYISTSKDSPSGGSWSSSVPTSLSADKYLWTRTAIVYKTADGTTTTKYQPNENGKCDFTWNLAVEEVSKTNAALSNLSQQYESLQSQIDGAIDTWYGDTAPTVNSYPTTEWKDDAAKIKHNGDLYYDTKTGTAYRYTVVAADGKVTSQKWDKITDAALTEALAQIEDLGAKVDGKMTIYYNESTDYPKSAEEGDLWIQGTKGNQYKCKNSYDSTTTINQANWTDYWELANQTIGQIDIQFTKTESGEEEPIASASWSTESPIWEPGTYIWQRTVTYDGSGNVVTTSSPVCITSASRSIESVVNYYLATSASSGVTTQTEGWKTNVSEAITDKDKKYLWNYEVVNYTYGDPDISDPIIIGNYATDGATGDAGRGIKAIVEYYLISNSADTPTFTLGGNGKPTTTNNTTGWSANILKTTDDLPYLWNVEVIEYTKAPLYENSKPQMIGYRGVGVKESTTYYSRNNSADTAPTSGWDTSFVDVDINNHFLWSYTKTTFTNNNTTDSTPAIIARYTENGKDAIFGEIRTNGKDSFTEAQPGSITLTAEFKIGSTIQTEGVTYKWTAMYGGSLSGVDTTKSTILITRDMVANLAVFACTMTYNDTTVTDQITIRDIQDVIVCEIVSSHGNTFTNGQTETVLTAYLNSNETGRLSSTEMAKYYYRWIKQDKDGIPDNNFTPTFAVDAVGKGANYRNAIVLSNNAVNRRAIFTVEVSETEPTART